MADRTVWRLTHKRYADTAFSGDGARQHGGRFNSPGTPVVYTAESLALALVEAMTGLERYGQLRRYVFFRVEIPEVLISEVSGDDLTEEWDQHPPASSSQRIGDRWVSNGESVALKVPSVVVPYSDNYLLNPAHPSFDEVEIGPGEAFPIDERLIPDR
jgi:RES domain-containing protein